ncbi:MAG: aminotransferase class I/II-fold pyridoxal phosphate-dependent enzyme [Proteobacteria bacterium]|nr:aminotransferase class I/II-fold pyridoxal phosphate-dependent enzyme [Pseudomonadota bacterium]
MSDGFIERLESDLVAARRNGTYKQLRHIESPPGGRVSIEGKGRVLLMSSNDYLGLAGHPDVIAAGIEALGRFGAGTASVRFISGTLTIHRELEDALARFTGMETALTYSSAWAANTGLIPAILRPGDAVISDALNHASIIDGCRLLPKGVTRLVYAHSDMDDLAAKLEASADANARVVITDGVFSMEGDLARLDRITELAKRHDGIVVLDDSHGLGVLGEGGRGTAEHFGLHGRIDIITGTLGKALGGGAGGFVAGPRAVTETLIQISRPHLFSNAVPAATAATSLAALGLISRQPAMVKELKDKVRHFRSGLGRLGITPVEGASAIVPVIVGETARAIALADALFDAGLFVTGFGFPVVPEGTARLRFQISNALGYEDLDTALAIIDKVWRAEPDAGVRRS